MSGPSVIRVAVLAILIAGLLAVLAPAPAAARAVSCPDRDHVTVGDLLDLAPFDTVDYWGTNPRAHACFGGATITIRGFANWPEGIGGTSLSGVKPLYFEWPALFLFASSREAYPGYGRGSFYGIVVPPRFGKVENAFHGVWVDVTARFEDPLANRCRGYGPKGDRPTRAEAVATCREYLVLTSIRAAAGPPDTAVAADRPVPAANRPAMAAARARGTARRVGGLETGLAPDGQREALN